VLVATLCVVTCVTPCVTTFSPNKPENKLTYGWRGVWNLDSRAQYDYKHYASQTSKQKETLKPQIQPQPAKEAPQKQELSMHNNFSDFLKDLERLKLRKNRKNGVLREKSPV
jgi:hypothetical protein